MYCLPALSTHIVTLPPIPPVGLSPGDVANKIPSRT